MYGVFILRDGKWQEHFISESLEAAKSEARYVQSAIGIVANVFKKEA